MSQKCYILKIINNKWQIHETCSLQVVYIKVILFVCLSVSKVNTKTISSIISCIRICIIYDMVGL